MTPEELVESACPLINDMGWRFYFTPETTARAEELGLDVLSFYVIGRGGVLGDGEARVVQSAFGYFNPALVATLWDGARTVIAPRDAGRAFVECGRAHGRRHLGAVPGLDAYCEAAEAVVAAADPQGLSLFAAASAEPLPDDAPARAMQLTSVLREYRGSAHLVALVASGLSPFTAHYVKRPEMWAMFGWQEGDAPEVTDAVRATLGEVERATDRMVLPAFSVLDGGQRDAMLGCLQQMKVVLAPDA